MYQLVLQTSYATPSAPDRCILEEYCQGQYGNPKEIKITNIPIRANSHGIRLMNKLYEDMEPPEEYFESSLSDVSCKNPYLLHHGVISENINISNKVVTVQEYESILCVSYTQSSVPFRLQIGWTCSFVRFFSQLPLIQSSTPFTASFQNPEKNYFALSVPFFQLIVKPSNRMLKKVPEKIWILSYDKNRPSSDASDRYSISCITDAFDLEIQKFGLQCKESTNFLQFQEMKQNHSSKKKAIILGDIIESNRETVSSQVSQKRKKGRVMNAKQTDLLEGCSTYYSTLLRVYHLLHKNKIKFLEQMVERHRNLIRLCASQYMCDPSVDTQILKKKIEVCGQVIGWIKALKQLDETLVTSRKENVDSFVQSEKVAKQGLQEAKINVRIYFKLTPSGQKQLHVVLETTNSLDWQKRRKAEESDRIQFRETYEKFVPEKSQIRDDTVTQLLPSDDTVTLGDNTITVNDLFGDSSDEDDSE